jgi:hypothetical protein
MIGRRWEPIGVAVAGFIVLLSLILWLDNVHIATLNGLFKSIQLEPWIRSPDTARLDASNYIYFPVYGALCRVLDWIGVYHGLARKQIGLLNAGSAGIALAAIYVLVRHLTGRRDAAALAALLHLGSGFFLLLAIINEDIMPGYTLMLWAMALAAMRFDRPTPTGVIAVGLVFTLGWLFEWRLMFPTLPALVAALVLTKASPKHRLTMVALLLVTIVVVAGLTELYWEGHSGSIGLPDVLWTGKGVASAWAGFSREKLELLAVGIGEYLISAHNVPLATDDIAIPLETFVALSLQIPAVLYALGMLWRRWQDGPIRATLVVFLGTFLAGEIMNAYSQPQDPQMQINVMPWLSVVWGVALGTFLLPTRRDRRKLGRVFVLLALSAAPLLYNASQLSKQRGGDTVAKAIVENIDDEVDLSSVVFLYWGFEPIAGWQHFFDGRRWDGLANLAAAPDSRRQFKWLTLMRSSFNHPERTGAENAAALKADIDWALDHGYQLVVGPLWDWSAEQLAHSLTSISARSSGPPIHAMLHHDYTATRLFDQPGVGNYYALTRAAR